MEGRRVNYGATVVMELATPIYMTGRNITMDNFFTSQALYNQLLMKSSIQLEKNRREVPPAMKPSPFREKISSKFDFNGAATMISYIT